jgi:hypothetical protein
MIAVPYPNQIISLLGTYSSYKQKAVRLIIHLSKVQVLVGPPYKTKP